MNGYRAPNKTPRRRTVSAANPSGRRLAARAVTLDPFYDAQHQRAMCDDEGICNTYRSSDAFLRLAARGHDRLAALHPGPPDAHRILDGPMRKHEVVTMNLLWRL